MAVAVRPLARAEIADRFDAIAALRMVVFRAWPYLYAGTTRYERNYLATYLDAPGAFVCGAFDGDNLVGVATASPLSEHKAEFAEPFARLGLDPDEFFYLGESVLLPLYRGQGIGVRFFEEREAEARRQGFGKCIFSAVARPDDHPARTSSHVPLDGFWTRRGYVRVDGLTATYAWKDIGDSEETEKPMQYWMRELSTV